ncbi:DNA helicase Pif1 like [Carpediemonas membranifera]|uniref:ATP-dependent DNA helicase n=1 Tax=Carpediemonas membranifera TaxID=201153 RepID=A0A8J6B8B0_9EUKA|nr:DNA helicase Pif1 like [Carpediemonas membranifera]|eukprot:KAG9392097.1 DNA helicase Pif1 like [Carpediemonas membranifera]
MGPEIKENMRQLSTQQFRRLNQVLAFATVMTDVQASDGMFLRFRGATFAFGKDLHNARVITGEDDDTLPAELIARVRDWLNDHSQTYRELASDLAAAADIPGSSRCCVTFSFTHGNQNAAPIAFTPNPLMTAIVNADVVIPRANRTSYVQYDSPIAALATFPLVFCDERGFSPEYSAKFKTLKNWVKHVLHASQCRFVRANPTTPMFLSMIHTGLERIQARGYSVTLNNAQEAAGDDGVLSANADGSAHLIAPPTMPLSYAFMNNMREHLTALLARFGSPHFFWTFTIDPSYVMDYLEELIADEEYPLDPPLVIDGRRYTPRDAPVDSARTCIEYFYTIFQKLVEALAGTEYPICEYATRVEEQENSMLHVHTVTWHKGIGQHTPEGNRLDANLVSAINSIISTDSSILSGRATVFQTHTCNEHCRNNHHTCKQGFPAKAATESFISGDGQFVPKRSEVDSYTNTFCPMVAAHLHGSMHVSPVVSTEMIMYIVKYMTKQPTEVIEQISHEVASVEQHHLIYQQRRRVIGPLMLATLLDGVSIFSTSRAFIKIDTNVLPQNRVFGPRNNCIKNKVGGWLKYCKRPEALEHITYLIYLTHYDTRSVKLPAFEKLPDHERISHTGEDGTEYFWRIHKRKVPYAAFIPMTTPHDGDSHYFNLLTLSFPWRSDAEMTHGFHRHGGLALTGVERCSYAEKCFELGLIDSEEADDDQIFDVAWHIRFGSLSKEGCFAVVRASLEKNGTTPTLQMVSTVRNPTLREDLIKHVLKNTDRAYIINHDVVSRWKQPVDMDTSIVLDETQEKVFKHYRENLIAKKQTILLLCGRAGSGKSVLVRHIAKFTAARGNLVLVTASTGAAAVNIGGTTIHSLFRWAAENRFAAPVKDTVPWILLNNATTLIIDEAFMLSAPDIHDLNEALCVARNNTLSFGGINMIIVGDPYQLPQSTSSSFPTIRARHSTNGERTVPARSL